jgi:D-beta-D-heptose 7-phosphate kinase/D-beta-D-heptose 1-phosphate adenosyltransferase
MSAQSTLIPILNDITDARVLCVGDIMLDRFISGDVARISPEAPVPVLRIREETEMLGGVGNVARNLAGLGVKPALIATVGADVAGATVLEQLEALGVETSGLVGDSGRPTAIKTRYLAGNQQMLRADKEETGPLGPATADALVAAVTSALGDCAVLVLSDYGKGVLGDGRAKALIDAAKNAGKTVIVDPKGNDYGIYAGADLVTPNRKELSEASGMAVGGVEEAVAAAQGLIGRHGFGAILVTLSQQGMALVTADTSLHVPAEAREVFDVSGAGDTVVATLAGALAAGAEMADAVRLANAAAGIVVGKVGTAAVYAAELVSALHHEDISRAEAKVLTLTEAMDRTQVWRRQGMKIGFTNGCFDLLHPGHISLLDQARATCDRLIVGLNSDESVARLKGPERPVQGEAGRATVLASLAGVDMVVVFEQDTPLQLIAQLRPDVLVKGADYAKDQVVGAKEVESWGGRVHLAELQPGHSTTATIERLSNGKASGKAGGADPK